MPLKKKPADSADVVSYESKPDGGFSVYYKLPNSSESKPDKLQQLIDSIKNNIEDDSEEEEIFEDFTSKEEGTNTDYARKLYD